MGLLKNYEAINPFITSTTDSLKRLKPGFEAPVSIVTSLGHSPNEKGRNRTILCGLIRDLDNPYATRFELRSPNPYTNTYTAIALIYLAAIDGIEYAVSSGKTEDELCAELSKKAGEEANYLLKDREYRSEEDVFDDYTAEERAELFGAPPATVWENISGFTSHPEQVAVLAKGESFAEDLMKSFLTGVERRWVLELTTRIIPRNVKIIKGMVRFVDRETDPIDARHWEVVAVEKDYLAKDRLNSHSLFSRLADALKAKDYEKASELQMEMDEKMLVLQDLYSSYVKNLI